MKATKKIVGAACALVAAVALSAGSTFAWFSQSGTVSATGMNVKAATSKNILISNANGDGATWNTTAATTDNAVKELTPSSTVNGTDFFYVSNPETIDYSAGTSGVGTVFAATTSDTTSGKTYVASYTFYVKADGVDGTTYDKLFVSNIAVTRATETANQSNVSMALRVSVSYQASGAASATTFIYAPVSGYSQTQGVKEAGTVAADALNAQKDSVTITTAYSNAANLGKVTTIATAVTIRVWYEGEDAACTSANALTVEQLGIAVSLSAADNT